MLAEGMNLGAEVGSVVVVVVVVEGTLVRQRMAVRGRVRGIVEEGNL
jgi:hypothetical protein